MTTYTTIQGDTWDLISYRVYGSDHYTKELIFSNSEHREIAVFGAGTVLNVPEIEIKVTVSIPPWLREDKPEISVGSDLINISFERSTVFSYRWAEDWNNRVTEATRWQGKRYNINEKILNDFSKRLTAATRI